MLSLPFISRLVASVTGARSALVAAMVLTALLAACHRETNPISPTAPSSPATSDVPTSPPPIYVALFTHIEDNTPAGTLGTPTARTSYLNMRGRLLEMAALAQSYGTPWSLQPDWKILLAALQYEDAATMSSTGGVNVFLYMRNTLGVTIDPHSHEGGGYNYTDVAHLLDLLGVGGSTVIGGHVWDPAFPQFQAWDRFRVPVSGLRYPTAFWRGDILMGSGTPNHVSDPIVSGVWRPKDRNHYFEDDPAGNITCVGAYKGDVSGISELSGLYRTGKVRSSCMLTASIGIRPADITAPGGLTSIENSVLRPLAGLRGEVELTTFPSMVTTWKQRFAGQACTYNLSGPSLP